MHLVAVCCTYAVSFCFELAATQGVRIPFHQVWAEATQQLLPLQPQQQQQHALQALSHQRAEPVCKPPSPKQVHQAPHNSSQVRQCTQDC